MNTLFRFKWFPLGAQLLTLFVFVLLVLNGLSANTSDMGFANTLRNTNLGNLFVWSYWWPLIILVSIFWGRLWCTICPVELVTSLFAKVGLKKTAPKWLRSGWAITVLYIIILYVGINTFAIHRVPFRMAIYLVALVAVSIVTGLLFSKNTFCSSVCPVGHLLGLYARLAPFGWKIKNKTVCDSCSDKSCMTAKNLYNFQAKSCGVNLVPPKLDDNTNCLVCGQCAKACEKYNDKEQKGRPNPGWFRRPWASDLLSLKPVSMAQAFFLLVVSGFVIYEIWTEWAVTKTILLWTPGCIETALFPNGTFFSGIIKSVILFFVFPLVIWLLPYLFLGSTKKINFVSFMAYSGIIFIPVMAAGHLIKSLLKTTSRLPYIVPSLKDPGGIETAQNIIAKNFQLQPNPSFIAWLVTIIGLLALVGGISLSATITSRVNKKFGFEKIYSIPFYFIPAVYGSIFLIMFVVWRF